MAITNPSMKGHAFLAEMYADPYFPDHLVDKCRAILERLCMAIEETKPDTDEAFLKLSHAATEEINALAEEFEENDSELETGARDCLGSDFYTITEAYGFDIDIEDVIAPRDW